MNEEFMSALNAIERKECYEISFETIESPCPVLQAQFFTAANRSFWTVSRKIKPDV